MVNQEVEEIEQKKLHQLGLKRYDSFVKKITNKQVMTPHTNILEIFATEEPDSDYFIKIALTELLQNYEGY